MPLSTVGGNVCFLGDLLRFYTPAWSRNFPEKLTVAQQTKKLTVLLNQGIHDLTIVPILRQINPIHFLYLIPFRSTFILFWHISLSLSYCLVS